MLLFWYIAYDSDLRPDYEFYFRDDELPHKETPLWQSNDW